MMPPFYHVVTASGNDIAAVKDELITEVTYKLARGWEPHGGVAAAYVVDHDHHGRVTVFLAQAMTFANKPKDLDPSYVG